MRLMETRSNPVRIVDAAEGQGKLPSLRLLLQLPYSFQTLSTLNRRNVVEQSDEAVDTALNTLLNSHHLFYWSVSMSISLRFPKVGTADQATLSSWVPEDGDTVAFGDLLYYVENGSNIQEITAPAAGRLRTLGSPGMTYNAGEVIGSID